MLSDLMITAIYEVLTGKLERMANNFLQKGIVTKEGSCYCLILDHHVFYINMLMASRKICRALGLHSCYKYISYDIELIKLVHH